MGFISLLFPLYLTMLEILLIAYGTTLGERMSEWIKRDLI